MPLALVLALLVSFAGVVSSAAQAPRSRLEPYRGVYLGVNLDWGNDSAAALTNRLGGSPAVYVQFVHFPMTADDRIYLEAFVDQVAQQGAYALITLEPFDGLGAVTPDVIEDFASRVQFYADQRGVPVFVRFAHEMNGSWYPWSQQPTAYVRTFRQLADAIHKRTPRAAMIWAPNYGAGYPFRGGPFETKAGTDDFALLDTNHDGVLDQRDDMYAPYYPGDDAVDWVGMSLYHWGDHYPWGKNVAPEPGKFIQQLTGVYNGANGDERDVPDFYQDYAEGHGKPLAITETAALFNTAVTGEPELRIKQQWWRQFFDEQVLAAYPRIEMINWFEWRKYETEIGAIADWRLSGDPAIVAAFRADLPRALFLFASDVAPQPYPREVSRPAGRLGFAGI